MCCGTIAKRQHNVLQIAEEINSTENSNANINANSGDNYYCYVLWCANSTANSNANSGRK